MHLTLKREATRPAAANVLRQQGPFDDFITRYNADRPHQALGIWVLQRSLNTNAVAL
jgi:putative transposase